MGAFAEWQPRYAEHGIVTFPVVVDEKRKKPAIQGYLKIGLPTSGQLVMKFPEHDALGLACKRNRISVLDVDTTDERELADGLARHGQTPFIVRSGSGHFQAWYRNSGESRRIRPDPTRPVDILGNGYVVAPPSMGARGRYQIIQGNMDDLDRLPKMINVAPITGRGEDLSARKTQSGPDLAGMHQGSGRNNTLFSRALRQAHVASTKEELIQMVSQANQQFAQPLPADEVLSVSHSAWKYKEAGRLMVTGGEATAVIFQSDIDHLWDQPTALSLLVRLRLANGHRNGEPFPLTSGIAAKLNISKDTYLAARKVLIDRFFLEIVHPGGRGRHDQPLVRLM
ncbi:MULTISPECIES: bifunctional DNA primase/polymerase [unclassified Shinella]|uniref:bifunctional DNA primase/polymerase n=1 Tax=unclassified Shinella TaxID=2643062 RepID=UPI00225CFC48|nr:MULTISPECIES: bifunctional DNA primase/polymerase [unclassified Shinella]MCO5140862.1 bifunctional DNA primase/polymerase [Shinella sp.]MDC7256448.1 bifunctional DNA primase/polymerase [Shinella sp. YE25]CAI0339316.1 Prim-Pol domain-containing protein [Rhizobiaceae bacterium]CAK7257724.1 DNA primase/polymerase bifunctional N-terminal domain-containing protein [Shinella sp. WSC3-e]